MRALVIGLLVGIAAQAQPPRIISTAPSITETLFALGLGPQVVGVTEYCKFPAEAKKLPKIGTWITPNMEQIVALRPSLVIVQKTAIHNSAKYTALKLKTLEVEFTSTADIFRSITLISEATGKTVEARKLLSDIHAHLDRVRKAVAPLPPVSAMFVVGRAPRSLEGIIAVGPKSYQSEVITIAGGRNILFDSPQPYPKVLHEAILTRNPDVIIDMGQHADAEEVSAEQEASEVALWGRFPSLSAVQKKRIFIVSSDLFVHPGPRVAQLAEQFARMLHPEAFR